jgi:putative urate catabolism protein
LDHRRERSVRATSAIAPRDFVGYGATPPHPRWPGGARIAVQFVLNYEEGGERNILDGDSVAETFLSDVIGAEAIADRHMSVESLYEYGSRAGVWRVLRLFERFDVPFTVFGVARALQRNPEVTAAFLAAGCDIVGHGLRWLSYQQVDEATERRHLSEAVAVLTELTGVAPTGWYTGRDSPRTRRLVVEHGGFFYDSDSYADDLPYWVEVAGRPHLVVPYTLDVNDMRFLTPQGFNSGEQFYQYGADAFDALYQEGISTPKLLTIGLHGRIIGRPGRIVGLERLVEHILSHDGVWVCRRIEVAQHWAATHPADGTRPGEKGRKR